MSKTVQTECLTCGKPVAVEVPAMFAGADTFSVACVCAECQAAETLQEGGLIKAGSPPADGDLFGLGEITITPGATKALADSRQHSSEFLTRHVRGDWGKSGSYAKTTVTKKEIKGGVCATSREDKLAKIAIMTREGTIHSVYKTTKRVELWVMTDLHSHQARTTVLLGDEY